jgi:hypothetical protein
MDEPPRPPDHAPQRERPPELDSDLGPRLGAPVRVEHHAQDAVDAEPGMPEAGVGVALFVHFVSGPRTLTFLCAPHVGKSVSPGWLTFRTRA